MIEWFLAAESGMRGTGPICWPNEGVALGTLISAYPYEWGFDETKAMLDS